jgi:hypothetical protein
MEQFKKLFFQASLLFCLILSAAACKNTDSITQPDSDQLTDIQALQKIVDDDESLQSFEPNYNEEDAMDLFSDGLGKAIFPVRVGQRMRLIDRELIIDFEEGEDTAYGTVTKTFEGILFIAASNEEFVLEEGQRPDSTLIDTLIQKEFTTVVTRNIKFVKVRNTDYPERNWKIGAVSLPAGGTESSNIMIKQMTVDLPSGEHIVVDSPNEFYLERSPGFRHQIPSLNQGGEVTVTIKLQSSYSDTDFVSITYGAVKGGRHHRVKKRFELIEETFDGQFYNRTFQQTWVVRQVRGYKHAIINAIPKQVLYDDATEVEEHSWGMPYVVR